MAWSIPLAAAVGVLLSAVIYMGLVPSPRIWASNMNLVWVFCLGAAVGAGHGLCGAVGAIVTLRLRRSTDSTAMADVCLGASLGAGVGWLTAIVVVWATAGNALGALLLVPVAIICAGLTALGASVLARFDLRREAGGGVR